VLVTVRLKVMNSFVCNDCEEVSTTKDVISMVIGHGNILSGYLFRSSKRDPNKGEIGAGFTNPPIKSRNHRDCGIKGVFGGLTKRGSISPYGKY
jgi:hypothetical protein